mgnify:CR=1 FL=1
MMPVILVADHNEQNRTLVAQHVDALGYCSLRAPSGFLALDILNANPQISMLIVDASLPDISAMDLTRRLCREAKLEQLSIIIISDKISIKDINQFLELGASYFVPKPLNLERLKELVVKVMSRKTKREGN